MNLTLGIIIDGFSEYKPIIHKISNTKAQIRGFHYYSKEYAKHDSDYMHIINIDKDGKALSENCPKHVIICGKTVPKGLLGKTDTFIQIPKSVPAAELFQTGNALQASHEAWYNSLLMAVINHKPIDAFLNIAAQALKNPIVIYNNNLSAICSAGLVLGPVKGTAWETVDIPGFVIDSFYTPQEIREISLLLAQKNELIFSINPKNDPAHSTLGQFIWIDGKLYGGIGTVDINTPFTEGQKETLVIISGVLKLYFQNHSIYMRIAEDRASWLDSLLDGVDVSTEIISKYLIRYQWKLDDYFCIAAITAPGGLKVPIISILDVRQLNALFPDALISVYMDYFVIIMRCADKKPLHGKRKQQLEQFLKKDIMLCCGISMVFNNFLNLRFYFTQSKFAAAQCNPTLSMAVCLYDDHQEDHVLQTLSSRDDLRCFCHPGILSLWESGNEAQRDLVHSLYHYFLNGRNISATADAIHIHRNTLIYRLGRIEKILNIDLKQPSLKQAFLFIISYLIVQQL